ncbi:hypothetical protein GR200_20715 [Rhizobium leguminosarum]|uniref:hypothetical protein n=1 Tax=Rhizobium leguminosarum TaxID=384 RepID=UPI0013BE1386|nr:hypothetical protein [Rhizobium leguminosarum]NEI57465.1 hypothetical protein [Rhizobium leguminosarum]NEI86325.1 hypothetical protein [Rhizobium leguminosarum]
MVAEIHVLKLPKERQIAAVAVRAEAIQPDIAAAVEAERERVLTLVTIAEQAARIGVDVDLAAVISQGAVPDEVREVVMNMAASERDQNYG